MERRENFVTDLMEKRSATLSSEVMIPNHSVNNIEPNFNEVSGILDLVRIMNLNGGNSLSIPYAKQNTMGNITGEGEEYGETETGFGEIDITGIKITAFSQYSEEVERLPQAEYQAFIEQEIFKSLKRKMIEQIIKGNGVKQFRGLYDTSLINGENDIEIENIDNTTLNKIVFGHNSSAEEIEGDMVLLLNKKDLGEFANVMSSDGKPVYQIQFNSNGMTGYINGTKFCICNTLNDFNTSETGEYSMVYLDPSKYTLPIFSPIEFKRDYSSGFRNGMVAVRGSLIVGGSVSSPYGLTRIKKK